MRSDLVTIGKVLRPYHRKGAVRVLPLTDFPDRFSQLKSVLLVRKGETKSLTVERSELRGNSVVLKFAEVETRGEAWELVGSTLEIPEEELVVLPDGTYYVFQLMGMRVVDEGGELVGEISEVLSMPANDVYVVKKGEQEFLIPAVEAVIKSIDLDRGEMVISPIPGLLD